MGVDKVYRVRIEYQDADREGEVTPPFEATSYRDAEQQARKWVENHRGISRKEFTTNPCRWDQPGYSPALKDRR